MSETMSGPSDWSQFYQQNLSVQMVSSGINPTNNPITIASSNPHASGSSTNTQTQLSPEGRVSKPARRRSRASRRTPTTLLNTDTTNFRAMVQQFTGGPSAPFGSSGTQPGGPGTNTYGFGQVGVGVGGARHVNPGSVMLPPGYRLQYQQNQPWMISLSNNSNNQGEHQGLIERGNMELPDGFAMENVSSSSAAGGRAPPPSNENRGNTFMF
ncbi:hypothetical protein ACOSP7_028488 [Xanthoceras sorbifolium]